MESTRKVSNKQEKRISKAIGGRQVVGSGSTPFLKGDVTTANLFIEAKTKMEPSKSIKVNKEWLEKAKEQAYAMRKEDYTVAISFGDGKDYFIVEDDLLLDLYKSREALRSIIEDIGGMEDEMICDLQIAGNELRRLIRRILN
jgi:hypothetical protein